MFRAGLKPQFLFGFVLGFLMSLMTMCSFQYTMGDLTAVVKKVNLFEKEENDVIQVPSGNSRQDQIPSSKAVETDASRDFRREMELLQDDRHERLKLACNKYHPNQHMDPDLPYLKSLYNRKYSFSICRIFKVASSSWLRAVLVSDGFFTKNDMVEDKVKGEDVLRLANRERSISSLRSTMEEKEVWDRSTNIITVRNPLSRIVSAYVDKMKRHISTTYKNIAWYVELKYKHLRQNFNDRRSRYTGVPTFEDFINFLLDKDSRYATDPHWRDYNTFCHPCEHKYDLIMKLETLQDDTLYLHEKLNISTEDYSLIIPAQPASNLRAAFKGGDISVSEYFESLPLHLRRGVYKKYQFDFDAFGYEPP